MNLETIFDNEKAKKDLARENYINGLKVQWDRCLKNAHEVEKKLSFLRQKGYRISIQDDCPFDYSRATNGSFPNVRLNEVTMINKINENEIGVSGLGKFPLMGEKHTYESFLKKLLS